MEAKITKEYSVYFESLDMGEVFSPAYTDKLFMKIEPAVIKRNGDEVMNAVSLTDGKLIYVDGNAEVIYFRNARVAL